MLRVVVVLAVVSLSACTCRDAPPSLRPLDAGLPVTGQWRDVDREAEEPIDARTVLPTGAAVGGPVALRDALLARPDQFVLALTEKLMMYALGRELEYHDMTQVRAIVRAAERQNYRFSALVLGVAKSDAFRLQAPAHEAAAPVQAALRE